MLVLRASSCSSHVFQSWSEQRISATYQCCLSRPNDRITDHQGRSDKRECCMAGVSMMIRAYCAGGLTTTGWKIRNDGARVQPVFTKIAHFQCSRLQRGVAFTKRVIRSTPKSPRLSPSTTRALGSSSRQAVAQVESQGEGEQQVAMNEVISLRKVVVIVNDDSSMNNLCQYLGDLGCDYEVFRNDEITIEELKERKPRGILVSPGPGAPKDSGISLELISQLGSEVTIFGVCMGLPCMAEAFGGKIVRAPINGVVHGKTSLVYYDEKGEDGLLRGLPNPFIACRYHSLVIEGESFSHENLEITAWTEDGLIMGIRHKKYRSLQAVQVHPESIIKDDGKKIVANFLRIVKVNDEKERDLFEVLDRLHASDVFRVRRKELENVVFYLFCFFVIVSLLRLSILLFCFGALL